MTYENEAGVTMARWTCGPRFDAVARTADEIGTFARAGGMPRSSVGTANEAICEVLAHVAAARVDGTADPCVEVAAATDGECLSVMIRGTGPRDDDGSAAFGAAIIRADHVEWSAGDGGDINVVLEFQSHEPAAWARA